MKATRCRPAATARPGDSHPDAAGRIALARSILGHAEGHEDRAIREAIAALNGATIEALAAARGGA